MTSGNHMVDGADRELDKQDKCPACGSSSWPEDTGYCGNFANECASPCLDRIAVYIDEAGMLTRIACAVVAFFGGDPYKNIHINCPEYSDALRCENCGNVERI